MAMAAPAGMDEVSRNKVWEEHVKKENHTLRLNEQFSIGDPRRMNILPEKPNYTVPTLNADKAVMESAQQTLSQLSNCKDTDKLPPERFALPVTGNMEYGFFAKQLVKPSPMFDHKRTTCDVTEYANTYVAMAGASPYASHLDGGK